MKLLRYGSPGAEKPGMLDADGVIRDLSAHCPDLVEAHVSLAAIDRLRALDPDSLPAVAGPVRLGPCVGAPPTFHAIGLNYRQHAAEAGMPVPAEPILFTKAASSLSGPDDPVIRPRGSEKLDYEVELGIVIGAVAEHVAEADVPAVIAGYCIVNDVSERDWQMERAGQWVKGKSAPTFGPTGPWLVTADEVPDPQALDLWLSVNGQMRQQSSTADMIFGVREIVSYLSRFLRLVPGDIIATGTPQGVAMGMMPPTWLVPGDEVRLGIAGLGEQRQRIVAYPG